MSEDMLQMLEQLNNITESVEGLKISVQRSCGDEAQVRETLGHIWQVTQDLERQLARPEVINGFKADAIHQIERVHQLIAETRSYEIDDRQMISIGFAGELMNEKIRKYLNMARQAARKAVAATSINGTEA